MYLMAELAGEVQRRVAAVRAGVDVGAAVAGEQLDHVRVAVLGRPVQRSEAGDEVARLGVGPYFYDVRKMSGILDYLTRHIWY